MKMTARTATPEMVVAARPPAGFEPITSTSAFGWENGPIFERLNENGRARGFRVAERHINAGGMCHGGMMMTFADIVLAAAVNETAEPPFVTIRMTTDFIDVALLGEWVEGEAIPTLMTQGLDDGVIPVSCRIRANGRLVASASGLFKLLRSRR